MISRKSSSSSSYLKPHIQSPSVSKEKPDFPKKSVRDPERRQERITDQHENASEKQYEIRERSVRTTSGEIDPKSWLKSNTQTNRIR